MYVYIYIYIYAQGPAHLTRLPGGPDDPGRAAISREGLGKCAARAS